MRTLLLWIFLLLPWAAFCQEDEVPLNETVPLEIQQNMEVSIEEENPEEAPPKENKAPKEKKKKGKKKDGPALVAEHKKDGVSRYFFVGEKLKYKTKTDKKRKKGTFEEIVDGQVVIDGKKVKVENLEMLGKKFGKTLGWRTVGLSRFALGTGIALVGTAVGVLSAQQYSVDNPNVVLATVGVAIGTGIGFVGIHLMVKGSKGVFQSSNKKKKNGWLFRLQ
jgi:hypothetical protein